MTTLQRKNMQELLLIELKLVKQRVVKVERLLRELIAEVGKK